MENNSCILKTPEGLIGTEKLANVLNFLREFKATITTKHT